LHSLLGALGLLGRWDRAITGVVVIFDLELSLVKKEICSSIPYLLLAFAKNQITL
jgi:hypothetical protein